MNRNLFEKLKNKVNDELTFVNAPKYDMNWFENKCKQIGSSPSRCINSIGTLGGG